ncbi:DUF3017 domain-containing protein [Tessaracoccus sp. OH4464_COT-324]|uniref:DUF3017 domain-containing protein n=1 Tax=Tessaracoccus sp. OH4464_COT-324 TaxID=2491059 RepID=UPI0018F5EC7B|nr:DUF3017 domain-containing protein [Tessaracoccus sp. OH4464_COT-324]
MPELMPDQPERPAESQPGSPWALLLVLLALAVGFGFALLGHWRRASMCVAGAVGVAGILRMALPRQRAGLLVVRSFAFDLVVYFGLAAAICVAALVVPA